MFALCRNVLGNRDDAEDAAQECFLDVHRGLRGFRGEAKLSTWVYRLAIHAAVRARRDRHPSTVAFDEATPPAGPAPDSIAAARQELRAVEQQQWRGPASSSRPGPGASSRSRGSGMRRSPRSSGSRRARPGRGCTPRGSELRSRGSESSLGPKHASGGCLSRNHDLGGRFSWSGGCAVRSQQIRGLFGTSTRLDERDRATNLSRAAAPSCHRLRSAGFHTRWCFRCRCSRSLRIGARLSRAAAGGRTARRPRCAEGNTRSSARACGAGFAPARSACARAEPELPLALALEPAPVEAEAPEELTPPIELLA